jgi:hypothetical protein
MNVPASGRAEREWGKSIERGVGLHGTSIPMACRRRLFSRNHYRYMETPLRCRHDHLRRIRRNEWPLIRYPTTSPTKMFVQRAWSDFVNLSITSDFFPLTPQPKMAVVVGARLHGRRTGRYFKRLGTVPRRTWGFISARLCASWLGHFKFCPCRDQSSRLRRSCQYQWWY